MTGDKTGALQVFYGLSLRNAGEQVSAGICLKNSLNIV